MNNYRVMPRDLFNEAKLLKCLGMLGLECVNRQLPFGWELFHDADCSMHFNMTIDSSSGDTLSTNVYLLNDNGEKIYFRTPINCREPHPLITLSGGDYCDVFGSDGKLSKEFYKLLKDMGA